LLEFSKCIKDDHIVEKGVSINSQAPI